MVDEALVVVTGELVVVTGAVVAGVVGGAVVTGAVVTGAVVTGAVVTGAVVAGRVVALCTDARAAAGKAHTATVTMPAAKADAVLFMLA